MTGAFETGSDTERYDARPKVDKGMGRMNDEAAGESEAALSGVGLFLLAFLSTALLAVVAWIVADAPALVGIDDAAITRNYAENIANGRGFVYYENGERVEGATSFLWTLLVALTYLLTPRPEFLIIGLSVLLTSIAVFAALSFAALAARWLDLPQRLTVAVTLIGVSGLPGYFFWTTLTMMEVALWSATLLVFAWRISRLTERFDTYDSYVIAAAALLPMIRPEGVAAALGLLALSAVLMRRLPRGVLAAAGATIISTVGIVAFRLSYFGYPAPNTFYAKVSANRAQDLIDGLKYLFSFITGHPFAEFLVGAWALLSVLALWRLFSSDQRSARGLLIGAATVAGVFSIYGGLGGDHFAYWRFLEPVFPLLAVGLALTVSALLGTLRGRAFARVGIGVATLIWLGVSYGDYRQNRFFLTREIVLVEQGLEFGDLMNAIDPKAVLGVVPAGGVSLAYDGPILDLLGLNWVEMAHANPVKTGLRNHASFDQATFWRHQPDLLAEFNRPCFKDEFRVSGSTVAVTKGLYREPRFRETYEAIRIHDGGICWRGFAHKDWVSGIVDDRVERVPWADVELAR